MISGVLFGLACMVGWGIADYLAARASKSYGTLKTLFWIQISGLIPLLPLIPWLEERVHWNSLQLFFWAAGIFLFTAMYLLLYRAFEKGLVAVVSPIFSTYVIVAVVVGLVVFRERLSVPQGGAVAVVIAGILLASSDWRQAARAEAGSLTRGLPEAIGAMLLGGTFFSILALLARQVGWFGPILRIRAGSVVLTGLAMLITRQSPGLDGVGLRWVILAGLSDCLAFLAFNLGLRAAPVAVIAPIAGSFSLITIMLALVVSGERPALNQWVGIAAILIGIVIISVV
jgi:drug/metabolite transporter (DMT)-like permease